MVLHMGSSDCATAEQTVQTLFQGATLGGGPLRIESIRRLNTVP